MALGFIVQHYSEEPTIKKHYMKYNLLNKTYIYRVSLCLAHVLPLSFMRWLSKNVTLVCYLLFKDARRNVENNLSHIFSDSVIVKKLARKTFINYSLYLADWAKFIVMDTKKVFSRFSNIQGREAFNEAYSNGKGIILLAVHLGNWELGGLFFSHSGIPINIITAKDQINGIADIRESVRNLHNVRTITIEDNSFFFIDIINALKRNEIVAMLIDRYERNNGVLIDFFGEKTYFPPGPVLLARSTGCAVLPAFTVMEKDGNYKTAVDSIIDMEFSDNKDKDVYMNLQKIVRVFERYIREYPDQWYNFSPVWHKNKPVE